MAKNIKEIMIALNKVLTTTVWVNDQRQIISLSDELKIGFNNSPRSIEDLPRSIMFMRPWRRLVRMNLRHR